MKPRWDQPHALSAHWLWLPSHSRGRHHCLGQGQHGPETLATWPSTEKVCRTLHRPGTTPFLPSSLGPAAPSPWAPLICSLDTAVPSAGLSSPCPSSLHKAWHLLHCETSTRARHRCLSYVSPTCSYHHTSVANGQSRQVHRPPRRGPTALPRLRGV